MEKLLAYHGKQEIKDKYVARMKAHIEADELVRGIGFRNGKGCAVGCTLNNYDHIEYENELGFPIWMAKVEDRLFERMSLEKSKTFPLIFLETIQPGMVLESIKKFFLIYILEQVLTTFDNEKFTDVRDSILRVITLHKTTFDTESGAQTAAGEATATAALRAAEAAVGAATEAAEGWAAAWAAIAGAGAAGTAAWVAAGSVASAVWAAAEAAEVFGESRAAIYDKYADKLIELIKQCTIER